MLQISEVCIISIDKSEDNWEIEGEIIFEDDLNSAFAATYVKEDDEFDDLSMELNLEGFDVGKLKEMIVNAAIDYEDEF